MKTRTAPALLLALLQSAPPGARAQDKSLFHIIWDTPTEGRLEAVREGLRKGKDPDYQDHDEMTPLMAAVRFEHLSVAEALVEAGADVNIRDVRREAAVNYAAWRGDVEMTSFLLENGADPNFASLRYRRTPLTRAAGHGYDAIVADLIAADADVDAQNFRGLSPLMLGAWNRRVGVVGELLAAGADPDLRSAHRQSALMLASRQGDAETVRMIACAGADQDLQDEHGQGALHHAVRTGDAATTRALVECGADPLVQDVHGMTPLMRAVELERPDLVRELLAAWPDGPPTDGPDGFEPVDVHGRTALAWALEKGLGDAALALARRTGDPDAKNHITGASALHLAARGGFARVVEALLERGADPDPRDALGRTPLLEAAAGHRGEIGAMLLEAGADPRHEDDLGLSTRRFAERLERGGLFDPPEGAGALWPYDDRWPDGTRGR